MTHDGYISRFVGAFGSLNSFQLLCLGLPRPYRSLHKLTRPTSFSSSGSRRSVRTLAIVISTIARGDSLCGLRLLLQGEASVQERTELRHLLQEKTPNNPVLRFMHPPAVRHGAFLRFTLRQLLTYCQIDRRRPPYGEPGRPKAAYSRLLRYPLRLDL